MKRVVLGNTGLEVSRMALGGFPFGGVNRARGWDPFSTEGRKTAVATIHRALDLGVNYIDTAPSYGDGNSESIIGEVMHTRREECVIATKVGWQNLGKRAVLESVHASLERLRTDHVDVIQLHGGEYTAEDYEHIMGGGPLEGLRELQQKGAARFIGVTAEEPWTLRPFLASGEFDVIQLSYNLIYQNAARRVLDEATERGVGVLTMRTMTSGIFQRTVRFLAPEWQQSRDVYEVCLELVRPLRLAGTRSYSRDALARGGRAKRPAGGRV